MQEQFLSSDDEKVELYKMVCNSLQQEQAIIAQVVSAIQKVPVMAIPVVEFSTERLARFLAKKSSVAKWNH